MQRVCWNKALISSRKRRNVSLLLEKKQKEFLKDKISNLTYPITIIRGNDDKIIPVNHSKNLPKDINIKLINEAGHMPHIEKPNEINTIIQDTSI